MSQKGHLVPPAASRTSQAPKLAGEREISPMSKILLCDIPQLPASFLPKIVPELSVPSSGTTQATTYHEPVFLGGGGVFHLNTPTILQAPWQWAGG